MPQNFDTHYVCSGCGSIVPDTEARPFVCARRGDGGDHVLVRRFVSDERHTELLSEALESSEPRPFLRFRRLFHSWHVARAAGMDDQEYVDRVRALDARIAKIDGRGFVETPMAYSDSLALAMQRGPGTVLLKNETLNVSGSHKARHLMQVAIWLETTEALGQNSKDTATPLAIASCGNAALAAAVVARAMDRRLRVFVPSDADSSVVERIGELEAEIQTCSRIEGTTGDPCMHAFHEAVRGGALPFGCQGSENGITVEGGLSLGYEILAQLRARSSCVADVVIQVGGGALGSGIFQAFLEADRLGLSRLGLEKLGPNASALPRLHTVQTHGASPLRRAYERMLARREGATPDLACELAFAAQHRSEFMWPWESTPTSVATGILDDETYDWLALVEGMLCTNGHAIVADEDTLREAHQLVRDATGVDVCPTGASGIAGLMTLQQEGKVDSESRALMVLTGAQR